jgi:hypothetical protein
MSTTNFNHEFGRQNWLTLAKLRSQSLFARMGVFGAHPVIVNNLLDFFVRNCLLNGRKMCMSFLLRIAPRIARFEGVSSSNHFIFFCLFSDWEPNDSTEPVTTANFMNKWHWELGIVLPWRYGIQYFFLAFFLNAKGSPKQNTST